MNMSSGLQEVLAHIPGRLNRTRRLSQRQAAWDAAASADAMYYIATEHPDWNFADFLESGEQLVATRVDPFVRRMNVTPSNSMAVDIGAGLGRASRALSNR